MTEEKSPEEVTTGEITTEEIVITTEPEETEEPAMPTKLRVGSYNIKHGADAALSMKVIASVIKAADLDIVGVQEVDYKTSRSNYVDQPAKLAEEAGMPYYFFVRAIDYQGGEYGTLILSRYPIVSSEIIMLTSWDKEQRALGHVVIDVDGRQIDLFNTHLSFEDTTLRGLQFAEVAKKLDECRDFILTGDFNTANFSEFEPLGGKLINNESRNYVTYPARTSSIDNIVYSEAFTEKSSGNVTRSFSDHYMLWAEFEIN